jgi:hypothetical protein
MKLERQAVKAWPMHDLTTLKQAKYYRRQWLAKVKLLGDKWLLAKPVEKRS